MINKEDFTIIIDTREHLGVISRYILPYFKKNGIKFIFEKLDFGDYSFLYRGEAFKNKFAIERKMSLVELAGNFSNGRKRFEAEFQRAKDNGASIVLMVENGSLSGIIDKTYNTNFNNKAYYATILSWRQKFNIQVDFVLDKYAGLHIYYSCYYFLRNEVEKNG